MRKRYSILLALFVVTAGTYYWYFIPKNDVPVAIGDAVAARPLLPSETPVHPYLAEPQRSSMHAGSYNTDVSDYPGPLGNKTVAKHRIFSRIIGVAPNLTFDSKGRLITVAMSLTGVTLQLLDSETLQTLAKYDMPRKSGRDNSGGGYFHLDKSDRVIIAPNDNSIKIIDVVEKNGKPAWRVAENYPIGNTLPEDTNIHDIMPDWSGQNLWFVTTGNYIGYRNQKDGSFHTYQFPEKDEVVQNSFAVAEDGIYVVSTYALYRFEIDPKTMKPVPTWREVYDRGKDQKPGTLSHGSGTSPTLIGNDLVAIADDGSPSTHIMVYKRLKDAKGLRAVCKTPIFKPGKSATENSLVVYRNSMIVQNDYGHVFQGNALTTAPGVTRVDVNEDRSGCKTVWKSSLRSQSLPRLSTATGLVYIYSFKLPFEGARTGGWYLTALDFRTGKEIWDRLIGVGSGGLTDMYSSVTAPVVLGPNGAAYVGIRTGVVMAKDSGI